MDFTVLEVNWTWLWKADAEQLTRFFSSDLMVWNPTGSSIQYRLHEAPSRHSHVFFHEIENVIDLPIDSVVKTKASSLIWSDLFPKSNLQNEVIYSQNYSLYEVIQFNQSFFYERDKGWRVCSHLRAVTKSWGLHWVYSFAADSLLRSWNDLSAESQITAQLLSIFLFYSRIRTDCSWSSRDTVSASEKPEDYQLFSQ
jgi:hypothetical protein